MQRLHAPYGCEGWRLAGVASAESAARGVAGDHLVPSSPSPVRPLSACRRRLPLSACRRRLPLPTSSAENSYTHRHMCEFTGLDFEMAIFEHYFEVGAGPSATEGMGRLPPLFSHITNSVAGRAGRCHESLVCLLAVSRRPPRTLLLPLDLGCHLSALPARLERNTPAPTLTPTPSLPPLHPTPNPLLTHQVLDVIEALFLHMFDGLATKHAADLAAIAQQYPFEPIVAKPTRITFQEGIKMLQENG
jgi:hypothetical protein